MAKSKKNRKWFFYFIIIFIIIGIFYLYPEFFFINRLKTIFISITQKINKIIPSEETPSLYIEIDNALTKTLDNLGIEDKDVLEEYRDEKKIFGRKWIYVFRRISVPKGKSLEDYQAAITREMDIYKAHVIGEIVQATKDDMQVALTITIDDIELEKLVLVQKKN
ncbi:MAG: hypothetical protein HY934_01485 [Candidatus Firestonebacteria bacterium]|nr:hypothetical protein [Candidatus Firestonebacteria bacterium]